MDRTFQTQMAESFCNDFSLHKSGIWDNREHIVYELNSYMNNFMNQLSMENVELYRSIHEMSRHSQYQFCFYLFEDFINEEHPDNQLFESIDEDDLKLMGEEVSMIAAGVAGVGTIAFIAQMIPRLYRGAYNKAKTRKIVELFNFTKKTFDWIKKKTATARAIDAIIYSNLDKCGAKCGIGSGINQKDLSKYIEYPAKNSGKLVDQDAIKQFKCLLKCYLEFNIRAGDTLYKQFQACTNIRLDRSMEMYINAPENISANCMDIYNAMSKHFSLYKDAIEGLPIYSDSEKQQFIAAYFKGEAAIRSMNN